MGCLLLLTCIAAIAMLLIHHDGVPLTENNSTRIAQLTDAAPITHPLSTDSHTRQKRVDTPWKPWWLEEDTLTFYQEHTSWWAFLLFSLFYWLLGLYLGYYCASTRVR